MFSVDVFTFSEISFTSETTLQLVSSVPALAARAKKKITRTLSLSARNLFKSSLSPDLKVFAEIFAHKCYDIFEAGDIFGIGLHQSFMRLKDCSVACRSCISGFHLRGE